MTFSRIQSSKSGNQKCMRVGHWNLNGLISKQFGNKLELREVFVRSSSLICSGLAKLIYCPTMGGNLTRFKIFTHTENIVNAITMAAEEYQFILRII